MPDETTTCGIMTPRSNYGDRSHIVSVFENVMKISPTAKIPTPMMTKRTVMTERQVSRDSVALKKRGTGKKKKTGKLNQLNLEERVFFSTQSEEEARRWVYLLRWLIQKHHPL